MNILHLDCSPRIASSHSRRLTSRFISEWLVRRPADLIHRRDLRRLPIPHLNGVWIEAAYTDPSERTVLMSRAIRLSDLLIDELLESEVIVLGIPMYNFGVPSVFKAYIDNIVRPGRTFLHTPEDEDTPYKPLVHGKRMAAIVTSGNAGYAPGDTLHELNHIEPYLRTIFGFIGIDDIEFLYVANENSTDGWVVEGIRSTVDSFIRSSPQLVQASLPVRGVDRAMPA